MKSLRTLKIQREERAKMNKKFKAVFSFLLAICLFINTLLGVFAVKNNPNEEKEIHIKSVEEFIDFTKRCKMDSYSKKLTVHLETDIDLSKTKFESIPIFYGTFLGNNHIIKG